MAFGNAQNRGFFFGLFQPTDSKGDFRKNLEKFESPISQNRVLEWGINEYSVFETLKCFVLWGIIFFPALQYLVNLLEKIIAIMVIGEKSP